MKTDRAVTGVDPQVVRLVPSSVAGFASTDAVSRVPKDLRDAGHAEVLLYSVPFDPRRDLDVELMRVVLLSWWWQNAEDSFGQSR